MRDMPDRGRSHDELVLEARARLERQAAKLTVLIGPYDTGTSLVGAGIAVLAGTYGRHRAAEFLRGLAEDRDDDRGAMLVAVVELIREMSRQAVRKCFRQLFAIDEQYGQLQFDLGRFGVIFTEQRLPHFQRFL